MALAMETLRNRNRKRRQHGASLSEYLPILAIVLSVGMQVAWRNFGDEIRQQGSVIAQELAGVPHASGQSAGGNGSGGNAGMPPSNWGQGGSGSSGQGGAGAGGNGASGSGNSSGTGGASGAGSGGAGSGGYPGTGGSGTGSPGSGTGTGGSGASGSGAGSGLGTGGGQSGTGSGNGGSQSGGSASTTDDASILAKAGQFAEGLWEGFRTQFWGLVELVLHPIDSAKAIYTLGEALVRDFPGTIKVIKDELGKDLAALTSGDPREVGRVIGENVSPASLARLASKLSSLAKATKHLDVGCSSFTADTRVWTDQGAMPIQDIRVGMRVLARNETSFNDSYQPVTKLLQRKVEHTLQLSTGYDDIVVTEEHPFWLQGQGWTPASQLEAGNAVATAKGDMVIRTITPVKKATTVYNFSVANDPNYFVGDYALWVHNSNNVVCDLAKRDKTPNANPLNQSQIDEILAIEKPNRPDPSSYLDKSYIANHLAKFSNGATRIVTKSSYDTHGVGKPDSTEFVIPKAEADKLLKNANGDPRKLEKALGLKNGTLDSDSLVRIDFDTSSSANIRMPNGNEYSANKQWIPGGYLPDGIPEAIIDNIPVGSKSPTGLFTIKYL